MFSRGEFTIDNITYGAIASHTKVCTEVALVLSGQVVSAYKTDVTGSYSYNNNRAKELAQLIIKGAKGCTAKNGMPAPFELGAVMMHEFIKAKVEYLMKMYKGEVVGAYIQSDRIRVDMDYCKDNLIPPQIPYVKLTEVKKTDDFAEDDLDAIPVRSVEEIALEKESVEWLANKKYYIVNDDEVAENIFKFLENYNNVIAYDTETTGLRINCFGKIGSSYMQSLEEYNIQCKPEDKIRADKLVGIIFCVEPDVSYYFPCFNRKFKNLYQDKNSEIRKRVIQNIKARYTLGNSKYLDPDMLKYMMNTSDDDMDLGVILMERVREILSTKHLVAHNGTFEWKVGYQYGIDTNIKDDTMIMHKIMYKFRSTTSNRGEPSDLKYLAKRELGMDQWELKDFFPNLKENKSGTIRSKSGAKKQSKGSLIDFSYMTYEGTKVYAPTDGDVTLQLFYKYKKDLIKNHSEMIYIYEVEVIVSMAIAYMEFYGHRIDETKIANAKNQTLVNLALIESEIRQAVEYADDKELDAYTELKNIQNDIKALDKDTTESGKAKREELESQLMNYCDKLKSAISDNTKHVINLSAPGQVADLFYDVLKYPLQGDKKSVAKAVIKALLKEKNEDGSPKYPVANMYSKYKNEETLLSKFFDNLQYFMYPGGFIFSSYGQIAAATGRMSCIEENTYIKTKYGYRRIKDIEKGDMVYCYDNNGDIAIRKVLSVIKNGRKKCIKLWFKGECRACSLVCTPDHRIRKSDGTWVQACKLSIGDKVSGMSSKGAEYELNYIENVKEKIVYDLEIKEYHNFIAGEICVHNCSKPNAQQYPKVITKIVYPRDGYVMLDADYSQIEYRVLTAMAHNDDLAKMFSDPDSDYHTLMASLMYDVDYASVTPKMRSSAKSFNFGIPYGMGFGSLAILLHGNKKQSSIDDAKDKYELYFKNQPRTRQFFDNVKEMAQINGWTKTLFNRYRYYSFVDADGNVNNAQKAAALRQAGNAVIQGTAADIFKIGVARNFNYIRKNRLFGKLLIVNMVHDEQLMELDTKSLNIQRVVTDVCKNMQFGIEGFPPLYVGAGLGQAWGVAKGKMAEIHPQLLEDLTKESDSIPIFQREGIDKAQEPKEVLDYFDNRIHEFRRRKVYDYLSNQENWNKDIHPAIGSLINLQFNYGRGDEASAYVGPNGEKYTDQEFLELNIGDFLKENQIPAEPTWFKFNESMNEQKKEEAEKESDGYDDTDDEELEVDDILIEAEDSMGIFSQIDESNKLFGSSIQDIINIFGCCVLVPQKLCGINIKGYNWKQVDLMIEFLVKYECEKDDPDALRIVFLKDGNVLKYVDFWVKNIKASELEAQYKGVKATK